MSSTNCPLPLALRRCASSWTGSRSDSTSRSGCRPPPRTSYAQQSSASAISFVRSSSAPNVRPPQAHPDRSCHAGFDARSRAFDFLPQALREAHGIRATDNVSAWGYDAESQAIIGRYRHGVVLDCGSGLRPAYLGNVVNFEVADYPTTDVLGVGQALPFRDDSFDAVFSFAVLEHVADPFACAAEIVRVLKPGGELFCVVPFLQPFHGFPDHYYNMTSSGLLNLFSKRLAVRELGVPGPGHPIYGLSWFLNSYIGGLEPEVAKRFRNLTVQDLIAAPAAIHQDFVTGLSHDARRELAATNYILADKPRE